MASTGATTSMYTCLGSNSVTFLECLFDNVLWQVVWNNIKDRFDWPNPRLPKKISEISKHFISLLDDYINRSTFFICELPLVHGIDGKMTKVQSGNPYTGTDNEWTPCLEHEDLMKEMFHEICDLAIEAIKDCHPIICKEANEILVFLAADSEWKPIPGVPCHLPLAYALKESSLSIDLMRKLVNDIRDHCTQNDIDVLYEVYDGQFLQLILKDDNAQPLTRMQLCKDILMDCKKMSKKKMINYLLHDAITDGNNLANICTPHNKAHLYKEHIDKVLVEELLPSSTIRTKTQKLQKLDNDDLDLLYMGSQEGRRRRHHIYINEDDIDEDSETSSDEDYDPLLDIEICDDTDDEENDTCDFDSLEHELIDILDSSEDEIEDTFLMEILMELRMLKSGAKWITCDINDLINGYLKSFDKAMNPSHAELDTICELILTYTGCQLYNKSSKKSVKVAKLIKNLTGIVTHVNETRRISTHANAPHTLLQCAQSKLLSKYYPKVFLEIAAAKCMLPNKLQEWEYSSDVQIEIPISNKDNHAKSFQHISFRKPSRSQTRNQVEHRTMDPTHILTNLRSQICRHGFHQVKTDAFHRVSGKDHNVLSMSIVTNQLDKQSADLAKQFFS